MILIISNENDITTNNVLDWLYYYGVEFKRINDTDVLNVEDFSITNEGVNFTLVIERTKVRIELSEISFFWYRRGDLNLGKLECAVNSEYLNDELLKLKEFISDYLVNKIPSIGNYKDNHINKLSVLTAARDLNINIPPTIVSTLKLELISFKSVHHNIITKAINNSIRLTEEVCNKHILKAKNDFFYTLFQKNESKFVELRIFFLGNNFWTSAIFSQTDEITKTDFRNYNYERPTRTMPFKLPRKLTIKLNKLIQKLNLISGSIDMILTPEEKFVLLEINPIGQFGDFSYYNNFKLEKKIAQYMINNGKRT